MSWQRVDRIRWFFHDLKLGLPRRRPRRLRSCSNIRLPGATTHNLVWCHDFVEDRLAMGGMLRLPPVMDEYTRECLAIEVGRYMRSQDVILTLLRLMRLYGKPQFIRFDNGSDFTATAVMQ